MRALKTKLNGIETLVFSPDGRALLATYENQHTVWPDWATGKALPEFQTDSRPNRSAWAPDNAGIYMSLLVGDGMAARTRARFLNLQTRQLEACGIVPVSSNWFHFTRDGGYAISNHGADRLSRYDRVAGRHKLEKRWTISREKAFSHYAFGAINGTRQTFVSLEIVTRGRSERYSLTTRSTEDGALISRVELGDEAVGLMTHANPIAFHPDGRHAATGNYGGSGVTTWSLDSAVTTRILESNPPGHVAYHPDGKRLAVASWSGGVRLFDLESGLPLAEFESDGPVKLKYPHAVTFSPDGEYIAVATQKATVLVWATHEARAL